MPAHRHAPRRRLQPIWWIAQVDDVEAKRATLAHAARPRAACRPETGPGPGTGTFPTRRRRARVYDLDPGGQDARESVASERFGVLIIRSSRPSSSAALARTAGSAFYLSVPRPRRGAWRRARRRRRSGRRRWDQSRAFAELEPGIEAGAGLQREPRATRKTDRPTPSTVTGSPIDSGIESGPPLVVAERHHGGLCGDPTPGFVGRAAGAHGEHIVAVGVGAGGDLDGLADNARSRIGGRRSPACASSITM